ncbi:MAG: acylphosphatase [Bacteroidetes bacterium]|jgi:acylphosphatase|nr:acylphosphatase [Bacteroidota bacterium]
MDTDTSRKKRLSVRITGRVQGVGFRHFTKTRAARLDVEGWVRNEPDGSVRLEAEGPTDALESLLDAVREGPRSARVDATDVDWSAPSDEFDTFGVRYV